MKFTVTYISCCSDFAFPLRSSDYAFFYFCSKKHLSFIGKALFRRATLSCDCSYLLSSPVMQTIYGETWSEISQPYHIDFSHTWDKNIPLYGCLRFFFRPACLILGQNCCLNANCQSLLYIEPQELLLHHLFWGCNCSYKHFIETKKVFKFLEHLFCIIYETKTIRICTKSDWYPQCQVSLKVTWLEQGQSIERMIYKIPSVGQRRLWPD